MLINNINIYNVLQERVFCRCPGLRDDFLYKVCL